MRYVKDPATGRRISRMNPKTQWVVEDVPELRIIDQDLWDRAQARLAGIRARAGADATDRPRFWERRRAQGVLTGKVFCGCCGGTMASIGKDYLACGTARRQGLCDNGGGIRRGDLEGLILNALRTRLMEPGLVAEFIRAFTGEWNRLSAERSALRNGQERELASVTRKLDGLITAMADGFRAPRLQAQLDELEVRRATLETKLGAAAAPQTPRLHPNLAEVYRERVAALQTALQAPNGGRAALEAVRELIERIAVRPAESGAGLEIELVGEIAAMVRLGHGHGRARLYGRGA